MSFHSKFRPCLLHRDELGVDGDHGAGRGQLVGAEELVLDARFVAFAGGLVGWLE